MTVNKKNFDQPPRSIEELRKLHAAYQGASDEDLRDWMRSEVGVPFEYAHAMREFFHQFIGLELIAVRFSGGASTYEFARTLIDLKVSAWKPVVYLSNFSTHGKDGLVDLVDAFQYKHPYT